MGKLQKAKDGITEVPYKGEDIYVRSKQPKSDEYYTVPETVRALEKGLRCFLERYQVIYCPFDSDDSEFVKCLKLLGYNVKNYSDDYKNHLLEMKEDASIGCVFSNPPFSIWREISRNLKSIGIDFFLIGNLVNAYALPKEGLYGTRLGDAVFKNKKHVPTMLYSNKDVRSLHLEKLHIEENKNKKPLKKYKNTDVYPSYKRWNEDGKPNNVYMYSTFCITEDSIYYDLKGPFSEEGFFNLWFITKKED